MAFFVYLCGAENLSQGFGNLYRKVIFCQKGLHILSFVHCSYLQKLLISNKSIYHHFIETLVGRPANNDELISATETKLPLYNFGCKFENNWKFLEENMFNLFKFYL